MTKARTSSTAPNTSAAALPAASRKTPPTPMRIASQQHESGDPTDRHVAGDLLAPALAEQVRGPLDRGNRTDALEGQHRHDHERDEAPDGATDAGDQATSRTGAVTDQSEQSRHDDRHEGPSSDLNDPAAGHRSGRSGVRLGAAERLVGGGGQRDVEVDDEERRQVGTDGNEDDADDALHRRRIVAGHQVGARSAEEQTEDQRQQAADDREVHELRVRTDDAPRLLRQLPPATDAFHHVGKGTERRCVDSGIRTAACPAASRLLAGRTRPAAGVPGGR